MFYSKNEVQEVLLASLRVQRNGKKLDSAEIQKVLQHDINLTKDQIQEILRVYLFGKDVNGKSSTTYKEISQLSNKGNVENNWFKNK